MNNKLPKQIEDNINGLSKQKFDTIFIGDYIKNKSNKPFNFNCVYDVVEEEIMKSIYSTLGVSEELLKDVGTSTNAISAKLQLEQFEKAIQKIKKLPPIVIRLELFPQGYIYVNHIFKEVIFKDDVEEETLYITSAHPALYNGIDIVILEEDYELKFNQGRLIYNDGGSKIIDIFEVKE